MTTTAATTSASPSTSNDSFSIQDKNGASNCESTNEQHNRSPQQPQQQTQQQSSKPAHQSSSEQKRPMNAFLLFCKRQRSLVREKYPNLENRGITKILGDWWSKLDREQKSKYTDLARQHKEAFMKANPDFKWCKAPMSTNNNNTNNNNNNNTTTTNTNNNNQHINHHGAGSNTSSNGTSDECFTSNHRHSETLPPTNSGAVQSNIRDTNANNRQHEAPKPPKKRFLERNDSVYTKNHPHLNCNELSPHTKDGVVPYLSLDQDTLDRVIDEAFSEKSDNNPTGLNMCKCSNRISTNLTSNLGLNQVPFTNTTTSSSLSTTTTSSSSSSYSNNSDEPVDFSMNRTINATRQQIINNLVEKMLSGPTDNNASSIPRLNGIDSAQIQSGISIKRDNPDDT